MIALWTPGPLEIIVILAVALLIFGKRLPDVARSLGRWFKEFKRGLREIEEDVEIPDLDQPPKKIDGGSKNDATEGKDSR